MNTETQALQRIEPMPSVMDEPRSPQALMRRATDVAGICREIVLKTACEIQGRKFVRVEGWESIATAHGCFAGAEDAERVYDNQGNHIGYKAKGVLRNSHGEIIATGEGYVGFDEKDRKGNPTWKNRAEYAGKAMAQTRAISRTCRGVFAHVVVLIDAGLSTTPAEEVPDGGFDDNVRAFKAKPANVRGTNVPHAEIERITNELMQMRQRNENRTTDLSGVPPNLYERAEIFAFQPPESRSAIQNELSQLFQRLVEAGQTGENALRNLWLCSIGKTSSGLQQSSSGKVVMQGASSSTAQTGSKGSVTSTTTATGTAKPPGSEPGDRAASAPPAQATEKTRAWFLTEMRKCFNDQTLLQWACDDGPPYALVPNEQLEEWPLTLVPTTKAGLAEMVRKCATFMGVEPTKFVGSGTEAPYDHVAMPQKPAGAPSAGPSAPPASGASQAKPAPTKANPEPAHHSEEWYQHKMAFGKDKGRMLGELDKKTLFGWWANFEVEHEYKGKPKKPETIAADEHFREMLDRAGEFYQFEEPDNRD